MIIAITITMNCSIMFIIILIVFNCSSILFNCSILISSILLILALNWIFSVLCDWIPETTIHNDRCLRGSTRSMTDSLYYFVGLIWNSTFVLDVYLTEDNILAIEPWECSKRDIKLGSIRIWSFVSHRQLHIPVMCKLKVLVFKSLTVNGLTSCTVAKLNIATLHHHSWNNPVKLASFVVEWYASFSNSCCAFCKSNKVFDCLGTLFAEQGKQETTWWLPIDFNIKEDYICGLFLKVLFTP